MLAFHGSTATVQVGKFDNLVAAPVENLLAQGLGQIQERLLDVETVMISEALDQLEIVGISPVPAADGAAGQAQVLL